MQNRVVNIFKKFDVTPAKRSIEAVEKAKNIDDTSDSTLVSYRFVSRFMGMWHVFGAQAR
ncbi:MAG: hypothetical protein A2289_24700 [Deltaproteobacteria bacterium RIFOXYA12_FULL_58_15]|nr:MAG: hypothetical protein A2289_24700 [Deltaproteobacteria bacterium RIFOXYA12_FULL_58_15]